MKKTNVKWDLKIHELHPQFITDDTDKAGDLKGQENIY